jgi:hypothetical protein
MDVLRRSRPHAAVGGSWEWWVKHAKSQNVNGYISPLAQANNYAQAENKQEALRCLEQAYGEHSSKLVFLQNNPVFDFLHSDARYRATCEEDGTTASILSADSQVYCPFRCYYCNQALITCAPCEG